MLIAQPPPSASIMVTVTERSGSSIAACSMTITPELTAAAADAEDATIRNPAAGRASV